MSAALGAPRRVRLDALCLDPNNPRLGAAARPAYDAPASALEPAEQERLEAEMERAHPDLEGLERAISGMGWTPIDPMLVWEPPAHPGRYLVLEGNSRLCALRRLHRRCRELEARAEGRARPRLQALRAVIAATEQLDVIPVEAGDARALGEVLPRLLGVRHITHARQWRPSALHRYIHGLYAQAHAEARGGPLALDEALLREVGARVCLAAWRVRRAVQAVTMQAAFAARYGEALPPGQAVDDADQAWFLALLEPGHARTRLGIADDHLALPAQAAEALFRWAFAHPRESGRNVWRSPSDVKLWNRIARFDARHGTRLADGLDPDAPETARGMAAVAAEYAASKARKSPAETLRELLRTLREVDVGTLEGEREELRGLVDELARVAAEYRRLLDALE